MRNTTTFHIIRTGGGPRTEPVQSRAGLAPRARPGSVLLDSYSLLRVLPRVSQAAVSFVSHRVARDTRPRRDRPDRPMPLPGP